MRNVIVLALAVLVGILPGQAQAQGIELPDSKLTTPEKLTKGGSGFSGLTKRPRIRSSDIEPVNTESNLRMMAPERLHRILRNSFCDDDECFTPNFEDSEALPYPNRADMSEEHPYAATPIQIMLGGVDYTYVMQRDREVSAITPLVMFNLIDDYCDQLVTNGNIFPNTTDTDQMIRTMYRQIRSRPISTETFHEAEVLLRPVRTASTLPSTGIKPSSDDTSNLEKVRKVRGNQQLLCRFFFLMDGGFILH